MALECALTEWQAGGSREEGGLYDMTVDDKPSALDPEVATYDGMDASMEDVSLSTPLLLGTLPPHRIIEQTPQPDGSVSVKASTTTPHANGYKDVKIDHYLVPASDVDKVDLSPGAPPPGDDYLSRVEYRVLSPGSELEVHDDDSSTVYTSNVTPGRYGDDGSVAGSYGTRLKGRRKRKHTHRTTLMIAAMVVFLAIIVAVAFIRDSAAAPDAAPVPPPPTPDPGEAKTHRAHKHHRHKNDGSFDDSHRHEKESDVDGRGDGQDNSTFASPLDDEETSEDHVVVPESHI